MQQTQILQLVKTSKIVLLLFCWFFIFNQVLKAQDMKQKILPNGDTVYSLSEKEEVLVKSNLHSYKKMRSDTIEDLIYKTSNSILNLYKTTDNKLLFDYGGTTFLFLSNEETYDYFLAKDKAYQLVHSQDFITVNEYKKFISSIEILVEAFCLRNSIAKKNLTLNNLNADISKGLDKAFNFFQEQLAVFCYLKYKSGFIAECVQVFGSKEFCSINLRTAKGVSISPTKSLTKIYEALYLK
jgi:hypothetical protein